MRILPYKGHTVQQKRREIFYLARYFESFGGGGGGGARHIERETKKKKGGGGERIGITRKDHRRGTLLLKEAVQCYLLEH